MAAGTVGYSDTRGGDRDILGKVASSIGKRIKQASDMAREERAYAAKKAEQNNTSLEEAGVGKGHFFKRALGSRFGGDRIARTRGRFESDPPAGRDPTKNYKQRFRGGFDYKYSEVINQVTNQTSQAIVPMSSAITGGMRAVQVSVDNVSQGLVHVGDSISDLAKSQSDMARNIMMNGAFQRAFMQYIMRQQSRTGAAREERSIERGRVGRLSGGDVKGLLTGKGFGGSGGPSTKGGGFTALDALSFLSGRTTGALRLAEGGVGAAVKSGQMAARTTMTGGRLGASAGTQMAMRAARNPIPKKIVTSGAKSGRTIANTIAKNADPTAIKTAANYVNNVRKTGKSAVKVGEKSLDMSQALAKSGLMDSGGKIFTNADIAGNQIINVSARRVDDSTNIAKTIAALSDSGADAKTIAKVVKNSSVGQKVASKGLARGTSATRLMAKAGGKSLLKKIPVIAGLAGIAFGIGRLFENPPDWIGAGLEIASGLMGATGVGAGLSLGIDGFLLARDMGAVPFAKGGIVTGKSPVNALIGETGQSEAVLPLTDKTFLQFGEGFVEATKKNKNEYAKVLAKGNAEYFDKQGGWKGFMEMLKDWNPFKDFRLPDLNLPNPFGGGGGGNRPGVTAGSDTLDIGQGGGKVNLTDEQYKWLAYAISGEAGPGDDQYTVAASILNRVAEGRGTVEQVVKASGQYEAYKLGTMRFSPDIEARLKSAEGQARLVAALELLQGRTDFKGQAELHNRVAAEDPMVDKKGNFFHYSWQTGPNSQMPSNYRAPNYQQFIESQNTARPSVTGTTPTAGDLDWWKKQTQPDTTSSLNPQMSPLFRANNLNSQSMFAASGLTLPPMVTNVTNVYNNQGGGLALDQGSTTGAGFSNAGLEPFALQFGLASK